jgi:hypothetical protein
VVDVGGAIDHGDHGDHCLQPAGGLHLAPEEKPDALFHKEKAGVVFSSLQSIVQSVVLASSMSLALAPWLALTEVL